MKHGNSKGNTDSKTEFAAGYLYRCLEETINTFADQVGGEVSGPTLAARMGSLLLAKASGQVLGSQNLVSALRRQTRQGDSPLESMEMVGSAHSQPAPMKRILSKAARWKISLAQKKRWALSNAKTKDKTTVKAESKQPHSQVSYWKKNFPTAKARSAEVKRRMRKAVRTAA